MLGAVVMLMRACFLKLDELQCNLYLVQLRQFFIYTVDRQADNL